MRALALLITLTATLSACGPSHHPHPAPSRDGGLIKSLNARGEPSAEWTETDLNAYEADLIRLEQKDDGTNHVLIQQRREALDNARAKKLGQALSVQAKSAREAAAANLIIERDALVHDVNAEGKPDVSWTKDKLLALKRKLARIDDLGRSIQTYLGRCVIDYDEFTRVVRQSLNRALLEHAPVMGPLRQVNGSHLN